MRCQNCDPTFPCWEYGLNCQKELKISHPVETVLSKEASAAIDNELGDGQKAFWLLGRHMLRMGRAAKAIQVVEIDGVRYRMTGIMEALKSGENILGQ